MAVHRLDELLAQTDPFDLAQAIERYVCTLDGTTVRALLHEGIAKGGSYYSEELTQVLAKDKNDDVLTRAFVQFLKSNLRAVNLFGPAFASAVLDHCPAHRMVAIGEERRGLADRRTVLAGAAAALLLLGAGAEHAISSARAAAQAPQPLPRAAVVAAPQISQPPSTRQHRRISVSPPPARRRPMHVAVAPQPVQVPLETPQQPAGVPAATIQQAPAPARRIRQRRSKTPPPGAATLTVNAMAPPVVNASPLDTQDMPNSYSDATPLPSASPQAAEVAGNVSVPTPSPSPGPKRHSWLHRTMMHFDPFQPGAHIRIP